MNEPRFIWIKGETPSGEVVPIELRETESGFAVSESRRIAKVDFWDGGYATVVDGDSIHSLAEACFDLKKRYDELYAALEKAVEVIYNWHNLGLLRAPEGVAEGAWKIYLEKAPEMAPIRTALAAARGEA